MELMIQSFRFKVTDMELLNRDTCMALLVKESLIYGY